MMGTRAAAAEMGEGALASRRGIKDVLSRVPVGRD